MERILRFIFPEYSKWHDIEMFESSGHYNLIQMRYRIDNNKKEFRIAKIGFINDFSKKSEICRKVLAFKNEVDLVDLI